MWNRDWTEPCGCRWDPSLGRHLRAKQGFCFHYADVYLPGNGQACQTKIIRHRPLRAVTPSGLRLPAESVTGMVSGRQSLLFQWDQHPKTRAELSPAAPDAWRNLVNFCSWFYLGACWGLCQFSWASFMSQTVSERLWGYGAHMFGHLVESTEIFLFYPWQ